MDISKFLLCFTDYLIDLPAAFLCILPVLEHSRICKKRLFIIVPDKKKHLRISIPAQINTIIYLIAPLTGGLVFEISEDGHFNRGPLGLTVYAVSITYTLYQRETFNPASHATAGGSPYKGHVDYDHESYVDHNEGESTFTVRKSNDKSWPVVTFSGLPRSPYGYASRRSFLERNGSL